MPPDEHSEGGHGEREPGLAICSDPMHDLLTVREQREQREHRFHQHAVLPLPTLTQFQVAEIPLRGMVTLAVAHAQATIKLHWFSSRQRLPPAIQRWFERPVRPICWGRRPSRIGWINAMP